MRPTVEVVRRRDEECECAHCGYPFYVGDRIIWFDGDVPTCSTVCGRALDERDIEDTPSD